MRRTFLAACAVVLGISAGIAADDPIHARQDLMKANGQAAKNAVEILKGAPFKLETVQATLKTFIDAADKAPALFPPGSDKGKTQALPAIWTDKSDFDARFAKLGADSKAALAAITDEASFKDCGGCHKTYRAKDE
jgi:cytochrome c556